MVVSVEAKAHEMCQVWIREMSESELPSKCRKAQGGVKIGGSTLFRDESEGKLVTAQVASGIQVA
jgi:hypothetical protein